MRGLYKLLSLLLIATLCLSASATLAEDDYIERRINIGLRLFRTLLASDINLQQKVDHNNQINLVLLSSTESVSAQQYADTLQNLGRENKKGKIHNIPIKTSVASVSQLYTQQQSRIAGIYIVDKLSSLQLQSVIDYGISHSIIVYSPFEGDVESGVLAGLAIGVRVRPFINQKSLEKSDITVKSLFLKVAKIYDD